MLVADAARKSGAEARKERTRTLDLGQRESQHMRISVTISGPLHFSSMASTERTQRCSRRFAFDRSLFCGRLRRGSCCGTPTSRAAAKRSPVILVLGY